MLTEFLHLLKTYIINWQLLKKKETRSLIFLINLMLLANAVVYAFILIGIIF